MSCLGGEMLGWCDRSLPEVLSCEAAVLLADLLLVLNIETSGVRDMCGDHHVGGRGGCYSGSI